MSTIKKTAKPTAAKLIKKRGNLKPAEIRPLVITARQAFDFQRDLGNLDAGQTFDAWRRDQVIAAVNKPGLSACSHDDFKPVLAHFLTLAGRDVDAFAQHVKSGKPTDHAEPGDTHEARRTQAHLIAQALAAHVQLATMPAADVPPDLADRRAEIDARGKGPVDVGYIVWLARQKTRRPDLKLGSDWQAALAERCTVKQLTQIRDTIINRIASVEGTGTTATRNKSQTRRAKSAPRSKNEIDAPRW